MTGVAVHESEAKGRGRAGGSHRRDIQGLRALAVIAVILSHSGLPVPGGFVGVDVFFAISGYVITAMLLRELHTHGRVRFVRFYIRRFKRLTPALALVVSVTMILSALLLTPPGAREVAAQTALGAVFLMANFVIAVISAVPTVSDDVNPLLHTWSLSVEEQFYLFFPALLGIAWAGWNHGKAVAQRVWRPGRALTAVCIVGALSFVWAMYGSTGRGVPGPDVLLIGFYSPLGRAWEFAVGAILALLPVHRALANVRVATIVGGLGVGAIVLSLFVLDPTVPWPGPATLLPVLGTVAAMAAGSDPEGAKNIVSRTLAMHWPVKLGDWSYSLYLWHWPVIVFATMLWPGSKAAMLAGAVLCAIPAVLSYYYVEQPIRHDPRFEGRRLIPVVLITVGTPALLAAGLWAGTLTGWW
ncbi:MAG: acyltransferase [Dermatophilus congolensis]|nr:acyltransferase [Dermatophilus congolensis]